MTDTIEILSEYGGWATTAICLIVIKHMASYIQQLTKQLTGERKTEIKESVTALVETREAMRSVRDVMERLAGSSKEKDHVEMAKSEENKTQG